MKRSKSASTRQIEDILEALNCTKTELALKLGICHTNISNWASGYQAIPFLHAEKIEKLTKGKIKVIDLCPELKKYQKYLL